MAIRFRQFEKKGKDHIIPDALSRTPCRNPTQDLIPDSFQRHVCAIFREEKQSLIDPLIEIKDSTRADEESQALIAAIQDDFSSRNLRPSVKPFKKFAHQLAVEDGLIVLDGHRIVIPQKRKTNYLGKTACVTPRHGKNKSASRARLFTGQVSTLIFKTPSSPAPYVKRIAQALQKERMMHNQPPSRLFEDASKDLFCLAGKSYLVYVNRLSRWIKISEFRHDPSSQQVISAIRKFFVDTGVPFRIRTDGGPQFSSSRFRQFLKRWGVIQAISSPHYAQFHGHAEVAVKAMKNLIAKSTESGNIDSDEFCIGLLEWLNTSKGHKLSAAEVRLSFKIHYTRRFPIIWQILERQI